jgi:ADP-ribosyl-[dinitrogen reductase] hydrolase
VIGAIIGDVVGSRFEFNNTHDINFKMFDTMNTFTDDTVLTVATADVIMDGGSFLRKYQTSYFKYPNRGWGGMFHVMAKAGNLRPYNSFGNGSAMRVSPCGWAFDSLQETLNSAEQTALVTHNHPEGVKGAQAVAGSIYLARNDMDKSQIADFVRDLGYSLPLLEDCTKQFDETCQGTIPLCMALFNETEDFEDAIRTTIAHGGDCDTTACIVGGIAEAYYGQPPQEMINEAFMRLPNEMRRTVTKFVKKFCYNDFKEPTASLNWEGRVMDAFRSLFSN